MKYILLFLVFIPLLSLKGQTYWKGTKSKGITQPELSWKAKPREKSRDCIKVFRSPIGENKFKPIHTSFYFKEAGDSLLAVVFDTTLIEKNIYEYRLQCKEKIISDLIYGHNLGEVALPEIRYLHVDEVKGKRALKLGWKLSYKATVTSIELYRSGYYNKGYKLIATLSAEDTSYIDYPKWANEASYYLLVVKDLFGQRPPTPPVHGIPTHDDRPFAPQNITGVMSGNILNLKWENVSRNVLWYQLFVEEQNTNRYVLYKNIDAYKLDDNSFSISIDTAKEGIFNLFMTAKSSGNYVSEPSDTLYFEIVSKKALKPPMGGDVIKDSLNNNIIVWDFRAKNEGKVKGYNVYASKNGKHLKLNPYPIPPWINHYNVLNKDQNDTYFVKVINRFDKESKPLKIKNPYYDTNAETNAVLMLKSIGNLAELSWSITNGEALYLYRESEKGNKKLLTSIQNPIGHYLDANILKGGYTYFILSKNVIVSNKVQFIKN